MGNVGIQVRKGLIDLEEMDNKTQPVDKPTGSGVEFNSSWTLLATVCVLSYWRSLL